MPTRKIRTILPKEGKKLVARHKGIVVEATIVKVRSEVGRVAVEIAGVTYPTLSAAAKAVTGKETNGWVFWGLD